MTTPAITISKRKLVPRIRTAVVGRTVASLELTGSPGFTVWLRDVDARLGRDARFRLGRSHSWAASFLEGQTAAEACHEALLNWEAIPARR
jgi:hypothetical protein